MTTLKPTNTAADSKEDADQNDIGVTKATDIDAAHIDAAYDGHNSFLQNFSPKKATPYIRLLRIDRPIGTWLLAWPALWGLIAAYHSQADNINQTIGQPSPIKLFILFLIGAFLTRSAGCVFNDIADRKIDAKVARTKGRPIASGAISVKTALIILAILLIAACTILLQLNNLTIGLGVFIIIPILIYPFMKRFTNYPQAMLSLCFSWGTLMGWTAVTGSADWTGLLLTLAAFSWTMGFDTIYAHQDKEDDAVIGMKSTALTFGKATKTWLTLFYSVTLISLFISGWLIGANLIFFTSIGLASLHASWQITTLNIDNPANCLIRFRSNGLFGLIILVGFIADLAFRLLISGGL